MSLTTRIGVAFGALLIAAFATTAAVTSAVPAHAHDTVVSASPGEGESLEVAPSEVRIEYTDKLLKQSFILNVTDANGADVTEGEAELDGRVLTRALQPELPTGQYTVVWRVVSADGHAITDSYQFAIGEPVVAVTPDEPADQQGTQAQNTEVSTAKTPTQPLDWGRIVSFAILGAFGGVVVYIAILALIRRTKTHSERK